MTNVKWEAVYNMGSFNFRQNLNEILYILDDDIKYDITKEEEETYREAGNYDAIYDYNYACDLLDDVEEDISNGLNKIGSKYHNILYDNDDNYVTYDEFMKYIYINYGYYEGGSIQLEDRHISDVVLNNKSILNDIIKLYKDIYNDYAMLRKGKTCGWGGVTSTEGDIRTIYD